MKCDICNKTMILPEKLGEINICKKCLFKINGYVWKYRNIENNRELEDNRRKAIEMAKKLNYPEKVIDEINKFFEQKMSNMIECEACGEKTLNTHNMGGANICKKCYSKIEIKEWKNSKYISKQKLEEDRNKILKIANDLKFPQLAINEINKHFDDKSEKNWIYTIDGKMGQTMKVYEDHFIIETNSNFNMETIAEEYAQIYKKDNPAINQFTKEDAKKITNGIMSNTGGMIKDLLITGVTKGKVTDKFLDKMANKFEKSIESTLDNAIDIAYDNQFTGKNLFKKLGRENYFSYNDFDTIMFRDIENDALGYIKFQNKKTINDTNNDVLFFYGRDFKSELKEIMPSVYSLLSKKIREAQELAQQPEVQKNIQNVSQSDDLQKLDDIVKFKELLDMGIITQEEYNTKKKELLGL